MLDLQPVALLTKHRKEQAIAPVFRERLDLDVVLVEGYDTDLLGTFTREVPRAGSQLDAARAKARKGMELSGLRRGIASEGSFGSDPFTGMIPWNVELIVYIDDELGIEVVGISQEPARVGHLLTSDKAAAVAFAEKHDFPGHHLIMRPDHEDDPCTLKGITDWERFFQSFAQAQGLSRTGQVFVESDLRANANPTRMRNIGRAAMDLADRLSSFCPRCASPGFWVTELVKGLPCRDCGEKTRVPINRRYTCLKCDHAENRPAGLQDFADPAQCDVCNP